jgi:hypothetical protein
MIVIDRSRCRVGQQKTIWVTQLAKGSFKSNSRVFELGLKGKRGHFGSKEGKR